MRTTSTTDAGQRLTSILITARQHTSAMPHSRLERPIQHAATEYQRVARKELKPMLTIDKHLMALLDDCEA